MNSSNEAWQRRYGRAATYLDDSKKVFSLARTAHELSGEASAKACIVSGEETVRRASRVGIFSGSFNPLTGAHLELAEAARAQCGLDAILWTSAVVTVDKERIARATLADRLCQLAAYADDSPGSSVVLVNRGLYADQARAVRSSLTPQAEISIIVGYDKVIQIFDPRYYRDRDAALEALFETARLLVAPRDGNSREQLQDLLALTENRKFASRVAYFAPPGRYAGDSSTQVRDLASSLPKNGDAMRMLVAPEGMALVDLGPYSESQEGQMDDYGWRARWQEALGVSGSDIPLLSMSDLVRATTGDQAEARQIRALLERADADLALKQAVAQFGK